jgi:3-isopropylmalate/(R)-2-methylmalate dehydratase small subunit
MDPITVIRSRTAVMPSSNIDTDQIIPARFLTTTTREGLGEALFADWRYDADGRPRPEFALNRPEALGCRILVAGRNIGCGSSREHAPWALLDFGFRAIVAPSYADIFFNNCFKNGLLPIVLPAASVDLLFHEVLAEPGYRLTVDLPAQAVIMPSGASHAFDIDPFRKHCLVNGLDEIGLTLQHVDEIKAFETKRRAEQPWLFG